MNKERSELPRDLKGNETTKGSNTAEKTKRVGSRRGWTEAQRKSKGAGKWARESRTIILPTRGSGLHPSHVFVCPRGSSLLS